MPDALWLECVALMYDVGCMLLIQQGTNTRKRHCDSGLTCIRLQYVQNMKANHDTHLRNSSVRYIHKIKPSSHTQSTGNRYEPSGDTTIDAQMCDVSNMQTNT